MTTSKTPLLSDRILHFLESHPGAFTAGELWLYIFPGNRGKRILTCHVQQALERRLFPEGLVAADGGVTLAENGFAQASKRTRWCAGEDAPPNYLVCDPMAGICRRATWEAV
jgi:hypothetical protein